MTSSTLDTTAGEEIAAMGIGLLLMSVLTVGAIGATGFLLWMAGLQ